MATRQLICAVLGHVDSGKCVTPDTYIQLSDGRLIKAYKLYKLPKCKLISFNKNKFTKIRPSYFGKRKAETIVELKLGNGIVVKTTPEHKYFILTEKGLIEKEARNINKGDFLIVPKRFNLKLYSLDEIRTWILKKLSKNNEFLIKFDDSFNKLLINTLKKENIKQLSDKINYKLLRHHLKKRHFRILDIIKLCNELNISLTKVAKNIREIKNASLKQRAGHNSPWIKFPRTKTELKSMCYIAGLMFGDGNKNIFWNNDKELIKIFKNHIKRAFNLDVKIKKKRTCNQIINNGGKTFVKYLVNVFNYPLKNKAISIKFPELIEKSNLEIASEFIKGLLDSDGYVTSTVVGFSSSSKEFLEKFHYFLYRYGCFCQKKGNYELVLTGKNNLRNFCKNINFRLTRKQVLAKNLFKKATTNRIYELTPISGTWLRGIRKKLCISTMDLKIPYYRKYESYENISINILQRFIKSIKYFLRTSKYKLNLKERKLIMDSIDKQTKKELFKKLNIPNRRFQNHISFLKSMGYISLNPHLKKNKIYKWQNTNLIINKLNEIHNLFKNFCTVQVKDATIRSYKRYVYDFTIPNAHNFIGNGVLIHNTLLLDSVRGSAVQAREAGGITQHVGASEVPLDVIKKICGPLLKQLKINITIPGLLFLDTPGHEAFTSLRERGGSIADIAILVVDIQEGLMPQTIESIQILKQFKVPFVVALNKIDLINGWHPYPDKLLLEDIRLQGKDVQGVLETKLYEVVAQLEEQGFKSERFDRVTDFTKELSIIPVSAKTGEGVRELLMVLTGLAQRFLEENLKVNVNSPAKASILEVKEVPGLGKTLDIILYDGKLREGDIIVIGGIKEPIVSKARALLKPAPLQELREKGKFFNVKEVTAASGVKVSGPGLDEVIPGMPLLACWDTRKLEELKKQVQEEIKSILIKTEGEGLIIKADSLGSLEAINNLFKKYPIKKAEIGPINKQDIIEAHSVSQTKEEYGVIIGFNVSMLKEASELNKELKVKVFLANIIYKLIEDYEEHLKNLLQERKARALKSIITPVKLQFLKNNTFRASKPAIIGVEILEGTLRSGYPLINADLKRVGEVKAIQSKGESMGEATKGMKVAISIDGGVVGRNLHEGDILYSNVPESHFIKMKTELKGYLRNDEITAMREILKLHRKVDENWGL